MILKSNFWHKRKIDNSDPILSVLLYITINIPMQFKTDFVVQGHLGLGNMTS